MTLNALINYRNQYPQLNLPTSTEQYHKRPIETYETLYKSGYIDLLQQKFDCSCILRTGGTSSLSYKLLPTSHIRFALNDRKVSQSLLMDVLAYKGPLFATKLLTDKIVFLCGNKFEDGVKPVRYVSNALMSEKGWMGDRVCPVSQAIYDGDMSTDNHSKLQAIAHCYEGKSPAVVSGVPSVIIQFAQVRKEMYQKDLMPQILIAGGCAITPYVQQLHELFGPEAIIIPYYNATEATIGYQPRALWGTGDHETLKLKTNCGVYYEFVEYHDPGGLIISIDQIKSPTPYILLISTYDGLCRYLIGDVIQFVDVDELTFRIIGRTSEYIDIANEHTQIQHIQSVIDTMREQYDVGQYCVYPESIGGVRHYHVVVEADTVMSDQWIIEFDQKLGEANQNYAAKRDANTLGVPIANCVAKGTFDQIISDLNHCKRSTQSKLQTLYPSPNNSVSEYLAHHGL